MYDYGFIGTGNMGTALASSLAGEYSIAVANRTKEKAEQLAKIIGATVTDNVNIAEDSKVIILGVKPQTLPTLLEEIKYGLIVNAERNSKKPIVVTMAAGVKMSSICASLGEEYPVIRIMPNTPVAIRKGVVLCSKNDLVSDEEYQKFILDFSKCGAIIDIYEEKIDAASVISGCGPAYIYMYINAMARAGEELGLDYDLAARLAKATAEGASVLSNTGSKSLEDLRIAVCSPGGSTIEGVKSLLDSNINGIVYEALNKAYKRTKELAGEK